MKNPLKILIVHDEIPRTDRRGCDVRLVQILNELRSQGHDLTFVARYGAGQERHTSCLEQMGIKLFAHDVDRLRYLGCDSTRSWSFEKVLLEGRFDCAILFHWFWSGISVAEHYLDEIRRVSPKTRIAVLSDDRHGLREQRLAELSTLWTDIERSHDFEEREYEIYRRADMVLAISEADRKGMLALSPHLRIEVLPMVAEGAPQPAGFSDRAHVLFLGDFDNPATRDGLIWFLNEVWRRVIPCLAGVEFHLAGNNVPQDLAHPQQGVVALGFLESLDNVFAQHRVFVSPVRYGTGVQTKILAALARGIPVVTAPCGAEGLSLYHEKHALITATPETFAEQIVRVYSDETLWKQLSQNGAAFAESEFSGERLAARVRHVCDRMGDLEPEAYDASHGWSVLKVEREFPELLAQPARERLQARAHACCRLAEYLLAQGESTAALEQLRHVFSFFRGDEPRGGLFARLALNLGRCYEELGARKPLIKEARQCLAPVESSRPSPSGGPKARTNRRLRHEPPDVSVIIPTYNRRAILVSCLAALDAQSLAKDRFEVIVIDDGSTDGTQELCQGLSLPFPFIYLRQSNAGAGAARKAGTEVARGTYLLLFNDDTIATPGLLEEHLRTQHEYASEKYAVLGDFRYFREARKRALTSFLATRPFLFPQVGMKPGLHRQSSYFVASNLSIRRDAVSDVGSFDPQFRVAEDTELGVRLEQKGYRILYHPQALAWHDHLLFTAANLIERARGYALPDLLLFKKHPGLLASGKGPFGTLDDNWAAKTRESLDKSHHQIAELTRSITQFDAVDFALLHSIREGQATVAEMVLKTFDQIVPRVHWFHLLERLLQHLRVKGDLQRDATTTAAA